MANYQLSKKADGDIEAHYEYGVLNFGLGQAQDYMLGLYKQCQHLSENVMLGRSAEEIAPTLRRLEYGAHVIFYMPNDSGVFIVRVLRNEMDFKRHI